MRPSWVEVDLAAIAWNVRSFVELVAPSQVCAVVKADGYGHGDVPVAEAALSAGATWLAVALVEEGIRLREAGVEASILVLSEPPSDGLAEVVEWRLTPTIYRPSFAPSFLAAGGQAVHLKIDTGMHRVGADPRQVSDIVAAIDGAGLTLEGVWTHFAAAEDDAEFTTIQIKDFDDALGALGPLPIVHMANTASALQYPRTYRDMVRVGLGVYGLHPYPTTRPLLELQPAMRVVSQVSYVHRHRAGARPSYSRTRPLHADSTVVTVPIGYADGYPRGPGLGVGEVLIGGIRYPLAGNVTMDQIVVDVGDAEVAEGDEVVLMGKQGAEEISADDWAERLGTINWEIVCQIGPRLPRRYVNSTF